LRANSYDKWVSFGCNSTVRAFPKELVAVLSDSFLVPIGATVNLDGSIAVTGRALEVVAILAVLDGYVV
jgi:hypothetical protein